MYWMVFDRGFMTQDHENLINKWPTLDDGRHKVLTQKTDRTGKQQYVFHSINDSHRHQFYNYCRSSSSNTNLR